MLAVLVDVVVSTCGFLPQRKARQLVAVAAVLHHRGGSSDK